jgi:hypothetical protein
MLKLSIPRKLKKSRISEILFAIGILLLVVIPKGGFKIAGIPITWGFIYLGILFVLCILILISKNSIVLNKKLVLNYLATLPFVIYFTLNICIRGYEGSLGNLISFYINFLFLPFLFYIILGYFIAKIDIDYIEKLILWSVFLVSLYGIFLFIYRQLFGSYIEIPYFTVNAADIGELDNSKFNQRGSVFKLISTYNNGNIFGVCLLMLFPIFYKKETSKLKILIVIVALFLTLSRTVWIGLIIFFIITYRDKLIKLARAFIVLGSLLLLISSIIMSKGFQYGSLLGFITDGNFGGRIVQIRQAESLTIFGTDIYKAIEEIVYLSVYKQLGIVGLILFCFSFFTPIYIYLTAKSKNYFYYILGIIIYLIICFSDGCMLLIPTLVFFYFISTISFFSKREL